MKYLQKIGESARQKIMEIQFHRSQRKAENQEIALRSQAEIPGIAQQVHELINTVESSTDKKWALALLSAVLQILNRAVNSQSNR